MFHQLVHLRSVSPEGMTCVECKWPSIVQYYNYHCIAVVMWSPVLVVLIMWYLIVKLVTTLPLLYHLITIYIHLVWGIVSLMMECMIQGVWGIGGTAWNENSDLLLVWYDMRITQPDMHFIHFILHYRHLWIRGSVKTTGALNMSVENEETIIIKL